MTDRMTDEQLRDWSERGNALTHQWRRVAQPAESGARIAQRYGTKFINDPMSGVYVHASDLITAAIRAEAKP